MCVCVGGGGGGRQSAHSDFQHFVEENTLSNFNTLPKIYLTMIILVQLGFL